MVECPPSYIYGLINNNHGDLVSNMTDSGLMASAISQSFFSVDTEVTLRCREGFIPIDSKMPNIDIIKCLDDGKWSEPLLKCKGFKQLFNYYCPKSMNS